MLTTPERIEAALALIQNDKSYQQLTISKFCKLANVNRSNLYERHPELLSKIRQICPSKPNRSPSNKRFPNTNQEELSKLRSQYKALLRVALEQQAEIEWLRKLVTPKKK